MSNSTWVAAALIALHQPFAWSEASTIDAKSGVWEITQTVERSGNLVAKEVLDQMPPDQRVKLEKAIKDEIAKGPRTHKQEKCLSQTELTEQNLLGGGQSCVHTFTTRTPSLLEGTMVCGGDESHKGFFKLDIADRERISGKLRIASVPDDETKLVFQVDAKWLSADCNAKKPE